MLAGNGLGITGAASTVARDNLTKNIIVVSNEKREDRCITNINS